MGEVLMWKVSLSAVAVTTRLQDTLVAPTQQPEADEALALHPLPNPMPGIAGIGFRAFVWT
jgi:hypothetical protein